MQYCFFSICTHAQTHADTLILLHNELSFEQKDECCKFFLDYYTCAVPWDSRSPWSDLHDRSPSLPFIS